MPSSLKLLSSKNVSLLIYVLVGVFVIFKGVIYFPDSYAFLEGHFNRSPFYIGFLKLFTVVFGDGFEYPVIIVQYLFIVFSIRYLIKEIKLFFNISFFTEIVILIITILPCIHWHYTANTILSEAIAYPLVLIIFTLFLKALLNQNFTYLSKAMLPFFVLLLTRGQFIAFLPVLILIALYIYIKNKDSKRAFNICLLILLTPLLASFSERAYNKIVFGYYVNNTMNYVHMLSANMYVSQADDYKLFNEEDQVNYFNIVYKSLSEANLTQQLANPIENDKLDDQETFVKYFSAINNERVHQLGLKYFEAKGLNYFEQNIALNELSKSMFFPLLKKNFKNRMVLFYKNLKSTFTSTKFMVLILVLLLFSIVKLLKEDHVLFKFMALGILLMLANNTIIAISVHPISRYTFYFDWLIFAIILLLLDTSFKNKQYEH